MAKTPEPSSKGAYYRKRVAETTRRMAGPGVGKASREAMNKKRKALSDMADNED